MWELYKRKINAGITDYEESRKADAGRRATEFIYTLIIGTLMTAFTLFISYHLYKTDNLGKQWILTVITLSSSIFIILGKFIAISAQFSSIFAASERVLMLLNLPITVQDTGTSDFDETVNTIEFVNEIGRAHV